MNKRMRKKKHAGEFTEYGCEVEVALQNPGEDFLLSLIEMVEGRGLIVGGGCAAGGGRFFVHRKGGSVSDEDRQALQQWFGSRADVREFAMGPPVDAWR